LRRIALFDMFPEWPLARQTPGGALRWGDAEFAINPADGAFDGCVVFDGLLAEAKIVCPPERTVFIAGEPPSIKYYHAGFLGQFHSVITCHSDTPHPRKLHREQGYPWHFGVARTPAGLMARSDYDALIAAPAAAKTKLISAIVSDKTTTAGHRHRRALVARLRERFGDQIDIFGRGVRDVPDKADGILPYRYHVALENSELPDYWTEKLADAFLGRAHPFYWGCPNIERYFPAASLTRINIYDPDETIATIEQAISEQRFEKSIAAAESARALVLDTYNLFALAAEVTMPPSGTAPTTLLLRPESFYRDSLRKRLSRRLRRSVPHRLRRRATL
jgi:Glycosyltransferase family 10 (fucosyltransferase) C-term